MNYQNKYKYVKKGWNNKYNNTKYNLHDSWRNLESNKNLLAKNIKSINPILNIISNMLKYGKLSKRIVS